MGSLGERYARVWGLTELDASPRLLLFAATSLLGTCVTFNRWHENGGVLPVRGDELAFCWPFWQGCAAWAVPPAVERVLFAVVLGVTLAAGSALARRRYVACHALMLGLWCFELFGLLLSGRNAANYTYFHLALGGTFLLTRHRLFFLRLVLSLLYLLSATLKLDEGWILGTYFTSIRTGLPFLPDSVAPLAGLAVIALETVGVLALWSRRPRLQGSALACFLAFHLYSIIFVGFHYPLIIVPPLLVLFGRPVEPWRTPWGRAAAPGWAIVSAILALQTVAPLIPGAARLTLEGNFFGVFMFEASHQCESRVTAVRRDGAEVAWPVQASAVAITRCDPYVHWTRIRRACGEDSEVARLAWTFDHAINGGPFWRIVDEPDACALTYAPLRHNAWIRTPAEGAPAVGRARKGIFAQ